MKRHQNMITALAFLTATSSALAEDIWLAGDRISLVEPTELRALYTQANIAFGKGDYSYALRELDYAAWKGSLAAAIRLCVVDAYGIGTEPNLLKAEFWCSRAKQAGHGLQQVEQYLERLENVEMAYTD